MKHLVWILLLHLSLIKIGYCQSDSLEIKMDTLVSNNHNLSWHSKNGKYTYYRDGKKITKSKFNELKDEIVDLSNCVPCYLISYKDGELLYEGEFYTDCGVGIYLDYYRNGNVKTKGHYKRNIIQNWDNDKVNEWCSIKDGLWEYFDKQGGLIKSEFYENGELIE